MAVSSYLPKCSLPGNPKGVCQDAKVMASLQRKQTSADCCVSTRDCTKWGHGCRARQKKAPCSSGLTGRQFKRAMIVLIIIFAQWCPCEWAKQQSACYPSHSCQLKVTLRCDKAVGTLVHISALLFEPIALWQSAWTIINCTTCSTPPQQGKLLTTGHAARPPWHGAALLQAAVTQHKPCSSLLTSHPRLQQSAGVSVLPKSVVIAITALCSRVCAIASLEPAVLQPPSLCLRGYVIKTTSSRLHSSLVTESEK